MDIKEAFRQYRKAVAPLCATLVAVFVQWIISGDFSGSEFWTAVVGFGASFYVVLTKNSSPALVHAEKAILPAVGTVLLVLVKWGQQGTFDRTSLASALTGLLTAVIVYKVPNAPVINFNGPDAHPVGTTDVDPGTTLAQGGVHGIKMVALRGKQA